MTIQEGSVARLGANSYRVISRAGRGIISQVFLATPEEKPDTEVIIKIPLPDTESDASQKVGLANQVLDQSSEDAIPDHSASNAERVWFEARVLKRLNEAEDASSSLLTNLEDRIKWADESRPRRLVVARLDSGKTSDGLPFIVMEKAPPEFRRSDIRSLHDEQRVVAVARAVAQCIALTHQHGYSLQDFEPETKGDRIRVAWSDQREPEVKIIDWNGTGGPEQQAQDLFYFGLHLHYHLLGAHLALDNKKLPPPNLGSGSVEWQKHLSEGTKLLLQKLLHRDPRRRYDSARTVVADLDWWLDTMRSAEGSNAKARLQDRLWQARSQERHDRVVAVADLAFRLDLTSDERKAFDLWARQARSELEKEDWQPLAEARTKLLIGAFTKAAEEFDRLVNTLPTESEAARFSEVYFHLARSADALRIARGGEDIKDTPEWDILNSAVAALVAKNARPREAKNRLLSLQQMQPTAAGWASFQALMGLAQAGIEQEDAVELATLSDPSKIDPRREDFTARLGQNVKQLDQAVQKLQEAARLAPRNLDIRVQLEGRQTELTKWRSLLVDYQEAEAAEQRGKLAREEARQAERSASHGDAVQAYRQAKDDYSLALEHVAAILALDAAQKRALALRDRVQPTLADVEKRLEESRKLANLTQETNQALEKTLGHIKAGDYDEAVGSARQALALAPDRSEVLDAMAWAQAGSLALQLVRSKIETARSYLARPNRGKADLQAAQGPLQEALQLEGVSLAEIETGAVAPKGEIGKRPFTLSAKQRATIEQLQEEIKYRLIASQQVADARAQDDPLAEVKAWEALVEQHQTLSDVEEESLTRARDQHTAYQAAEEALASVQAAPEDVQAAFSGLAPYFGRRAGELRGQLIQAWCDAVKRISDWPEVQRRLQEGITYFQGASADTELLDEMQASVSTGLAVAGKLERKPDEAFPGWLDPDNDAETRAGLAQCVKDIDRLQGLDNWTQLQSAARQWRTTLVDDVASYARQSLDDVRSKARGKQFDEAQQRATALQETIASAGAAWLALPSETDRELKGLAAGLQQFAAAQKQVADAAELLSKQELTFSTAAEQLRQITLPEHGDIPTDDLKTTIKQVELGAELQSVLDSQPDAKAYAATLDDIWRLQRRNIAEGPLHEQLHDLQEKLQAKEDDLARDLDKDFQAAIAELKDQPHGNPGDVLRLYRQTAWWKAFKNGQGQPTATDLDDPAKQVAALALELLKSAVEEFRKFKEPSELEHIETILGNVAVIGEETRKSPELWQSSDSEMKMSTWPAKTPYTPPLFTFDLNDVRLWRDVVVWLRSGNNSVPAAGNAATGSREQSNNDEAGTLAAIGEQDTDGLTAALDADPNLDTLAATDEQDNDDLESRLQLIRSHAGEMEARLKRLEQVWSILKQGPWKTDDSPMKLMMEADLHGKMATALTHASRLGKDREVIGALEAMQKDIEQNRWRETLGEYSLWILQNQRGQLRNLFDTLRKRLIGQLGDQVAAILGGSADAAQSLRTDLLLKPKTRWVGQQVYDAVIDGVDKRSQNEAGVGRRDSAIDLWQKVIDATQPWQADEIGQPKRKFWQRKASTTTADPGMIGKPKTKPDRTKAATTASPPGTAESPSGETAPSHAPPSTGTPTKPRKRD
jgi:hypothetical protein